MCSGPIYYFASVHISNGIMLKCYSGGFAIGDIDNDGIPGLFFTGNQVRPKLYKNPGNMKFKDITGAARLDKIPKGWYTGTSMVSGILNQHPLILPIYYGFQ